MSFISLILMQNDGFSDFQTIKLHFVNKKLGDTKAYTKRLKEIRWKSVKAEVGKLFEALPFYLIRLCFETVLNL